MNILVRETEAIIKQDIIYSLKTSGYSVDTFIDKSSYDSILIGDSYRDISIIKNELAHLSDILIFIGSKDINTDFKQLFPKHKIKILEKPFYSEDLKITIKELKNQVN